MDAEEIRLRSLLSIRTGDNKYIKNIPRELEVYGLYPEIIGQDDTEALKSLKEKLDHEI